MILSQSTGVVAVHHKASDVTKSETPAPPPPKYKVMYPEDASVRSRVADPDSIGSMDPDPESESGFGSGFRRAKMTHRSRKFF
jgi:hypothetical protein